MTEGQVIKFMCVILLCPGVGIETVALAARTCLELFIIYVCIYVYVCACACVSVCVCVC